MSLSRMLPLAATFMIAAAVVGVTLSTVAIAADPAPRYRLEQGRVFGYAALLEVQQAGRTEYHVGFPLFAVSATANRQATAVLAFGLEQVKSPAAIPSKPAEFHTEKISLQGGNYSLNEERRSFRYLPGSFVDQMFTPLPDRAERQWGDNDPFIVIGSTDLGRQETSYELLDTTWRFRETFFKQIKGKDGTPKEEWRGTGEVQFDLHRGLIARRDFALVYSKPPGDARSQVRVKLSLRLLDDAELKQAAQATAVRLPGEAFLSQEKGEIRAVTGSGRWAHADTSFYDTQKLFATHEGRVYRAQIVGEAQRGQLCYRLTGSQAFWDGYQPAEKFQFIPGEINPTAGNVAMIHDDQRARLLADLQGGEVQRAAKAIEQLADLRPQQLDDEMAAAMVTWIGVTERHLASDFSDAMQHWATLATAPELIELLGMPDGVVRRIADAGLTGIGAPAEGEVARHIQHPNVETRERLLSLLGRIGTPQSLPALDAIKEQGADKKIRQAASFAAVQIRQRHGLESPIASEMEDRRREFERDREKWRADFDRKRQQGDEDFRRHVEQQRRKAEEHRKKFEADSKARRAAKR